VAVTSRVRNPRKETEFVLLLLLLLLLLLFLLRRMLLLFRPNELQTVHPQLFHAKC
jgi:hypothetical protein